MYSISSLLKRFAKDITALVDIDYPEPKRDGVIKKFNQAVDFLKKDKYKAAMPLLVADDVKSSMKLRIDKAKNIPEVKKADEAWKESINLCKHEHPKTIDQVKKTVEYLMMAYPKVKQRKVKLSYETVC